VAAYYWAGSLLSSLTGMSSEGLSSVALQQGGIGLILTVMLVSAPPMAAAFFNGVMGQFQSYSAYQGGLGAGARGPGSPPMPGQASGSASRDRYDRGEEIRSGAVGATSDPRTLGLNQHATGVPNDRVASSGAGSRGLAGSASAESLRAPMQGSPASQPAQPIPPPPMQPPSRNG
jgi:type IV secretion system protein VirB6